MGASPDVALNEELVYKEDKVSLNCSHIMALKQFIIFASYVFRSRGCIRGRVETSVV